VAGKNNKVGRTLFGVIIKVPMCMWRIKQCGRVVRKGRVLPLKNFEICVT